MASIDAHCAKCKMTLGKSYREVHMWLDEFILDRDNGSKHIPRRHHDKGVQDAVRLFGAEAGVAALIHIITDLMEEGWTEQDRFPENETDYVTLTQKYHIDRNPDRPSKGSEKQEEG
jgi:hypothetical protein